MKKNINIVIQARMGSTRLPGKVLLPVMDRPLLSYLLERLDAVKTTHKLIIATTVNAQDDVIESFAQKENRLVFRGNEDDVLDRYYQACRAYPADIIVRITSDCPLMDPAIVDCALDLFQKSYTPLHYLSNTLQRTFPRGMDVEVISFEALEIAAKESTVLSDREHVTPFITRQSQRFHLSNFTHTPEAEQYRLTVDTPEDFLLIKKIFEYLYPKNKVFSLTDILKTFEQHPEWAQINAHVKQKEI